eukprot:Skav205626  [mRNA]  locus=scaffold4676:80013:86058:- [translate_table: standard]
MASRAIERLSVCRTDEDGNRVLKGKMASGNAQLLLQQRMNLLSCPKPSAQQKPKVLGSLAAHAGAMQQEAEAEATAALKTSAEKMPQQVAEKQVLSFVAREAAKSSNINCFKFIIMIVLGILLCVAAYSLICGALCLFQVWRLATQMAAILTKNTCAVLMTLSHRFPCKSPEEAAEVDGTEDVSQKHTEENPSFAKHAAESSMATRREIPTPASAALQMVTLPFYPWLMLLPSNLWLLMMYCRNGVSAEPIYISPWARMVAQSSLSAPPAKSLCKHNTGYCSEQWVQMLWRSSVGRNMPTLTMIFPARVRTGRL